jgi:AhpD family alkylhydroperoxidase
MSAAAGGRSDGGTPHEDGGPTRPEGRGTTGGVNPARIPPGGFKELGPVNWAIAKLGARGIRAPKFHLFNVLGQHKLLFLAWLPFSGYLLYAGKLSRKDAELVILRVGHLRDCEYELQQHRRLAKSRGVGSELQARIFEGPDAEGLSERERVLITATDEFVITRSMSPETWAALSRILSRPQLIEFCTLAGQYDALAATMATLKIPLDFPD